MPQTLRKHIHCQAQVLGSASRFQPCRPLCTQVGQATPESFSLASSVTQHAAAHITVRTMPALTRSACLRGYATVISVAFSSAARGHVQLSAWPRAHWRPVCVTVPGHLTCLDHGSLRHSPASDTTSSPQSDRHHATCAFALPSPSSRCTDDYRHHTVMYKH
jgi:hypothetical protein